MQFDRPVLSVILPVFNCQKYLGDAIESILNQTFGGFELLIADDGSNDRSLQIISQYARKDARIRCFHNDRNMGKTYTVNRLFQFSTGQYITIHDADDISAPSRFEQQVKALQMDESLGVCGVSFLTIDEKGFVLDYNRMPDRWQEIEQNIHAKSQFHGPTMMMRREIVASIAEVYRPYFRDNYEDTDLAARILDNYKGTNLNGYLYVYRILGSSLCRKNVDVRNRNLYKAVAFLREQRRQFGADYLMQGKPEKLDDFLERETVLYRDDPALIYREAAAYYLFFNLFIKALSSACRGVVVRPLDLKNIRTVVYILRKLAFKTVETNKTHYKEVLS